MPGFPEYRPRRLRRTPTLRRLARETRVSADGLILPLIVTEGRGVRRPVTSMPGVAQTSVDELLRDAAEAMRLAYEAAYGDFAERIGPGSVKLGDFSLLSVINRNPGITQVMLQVRERVPGRLNGVVPGLGE
jgi:hypothetical protein